MSSLNQDGSITREVRSLRFAVAQFINKLQLLFVQNPVSEVLLPNRLLCFSDKDPTLTESQKAVFYVVENSLGGLLILTSDQQSNFL